MDRKVNPMLPFSIILILFILIIMQVTFRVSAKEAPKTVTIYDEALPELETPDIDTTLYPAKVTAYLDSGYTKSGKYTRTGICAGKEEWLGCVAVVYKRMPDGSVGDFIGRYEILDTGGTQALKNGDVIDVWVPNDAVCTDFVNFTYEGGCNGNIYVQIVRGQG